MRRTFWNNNCPKEKVDLVLEKTIKQDNTYSTSITFFQHYILIPLTTTHNSNASCTPNSSHHTIYPYPGCHIREPNYHHGWKYTCIRSIKTSLCNIIKTTPYTQEWVKKFNSTYLPKSSLLLNKLLHLICLTSYNNYLNLFSTTPTLYNINNSIDSLSTTIHSSVSYTFDFDFSFISKCLLVSPFYVNQFKNSLITFSSYRSFNFFTDGSLSHIGTPECRYSFGWIQVAPNTPRLQFQECSCFSPSSTHAEIFSILTVLLSIPSNSSRCSEKRSHSNKSSFISAQLATFVWNGMASITKNIRKFCNMPTAAAEFTRLMNSSSYAPITDSILANLIDWDLTSKWIKCNPLDSPISWKLSAIQSYKVKSATFHLPTLDK
ncbi:hypothetical protein GLOIN_2v1780032 [Rhizophagus clarus]|uniref:Uncharacterized protein n=2 Tax=Rhizophagus clarus TaxID=94130 RepID=A0A8H3R1Z8_9GLOM|nr:hypothetical protein GLOIN_2v1780032 [Rhizophagus clarus]